MILNKTQLNLHNTTGNQFTSYSKTSVTISNVNYCNNMVVSADLIIKIDHVPSLELLDIDLFSSIVQSHNNKYDLILFAGSSNIKQPPTHIMQYLLQHQISFECMSIPALCRTFNYVVGERRQLLAFIFFDFF